MKILFCFFPSLMILFTSCSKNNIATPKQTIVYINGVDYPVAIIGNQTWTAANYNGDGGVVYNNGSDNISDGKLYTMEEAKAIPLPNGWRLPTADDINSLLSAEGVTEPAKGSISLNAGRGAPVKALMSTTGWINGSGTNSSGFNAEPVGYFNQGRNSSSTFNSAGVEALFITTANYMGTPLSFNIYQYNPAGGDNLAFLSDHVILLTDRASVRFVKDN